MLFVCTILYQKGAIEFAGVLISTVALMSSFGPCVALAALGSTLQNTFAAGNRVLDILDEKPLVEEITGKAPVYLKVKQKERARILVSKIATHFATRRQI